jgi:hypothetical protein
MCVCAHAHTLACEIKSTYTSKITVILFLITLRERWKNERIRKENSKPEHSPFMPDILMISLPLLPTILFGCSQGSPSSMVCGIILCYFYFLFEGGVVQFA